MCVENIRKVLDLLELFNVKATFFVQGMVAERFPGLIEEIDKRGHEIQSHGYSHRAIRSLGLKAFGWELLRTNEILEGITGKKITGFRAPDFSIGPDEFWAFEILSECGIKFDSSLFPLKTLRYGSSLFGKSIYKIITSHNTIYEIPVSVIRIGNSNIGIPIGGGGYVRFLPERLLLSFMGMLQKQGIPYVFYCHPYEFNPYEWNQLPQKVSAVYRFHQGLGRRSMMRKVTALLQNGRFGTVSHFLRQIQSGGEKLGNENSFHIS